MLIFFSISAQSAAHGWTWFYFFLYKYILINHNFIVSQQQHIESELLFYSVWDCKCFWHCNFHFFWEDFLLEVGTWLWRFASIQSQKSVRSGTDVARWALACRQCSCSSQRFSEVIRFDLVQVSLILPNWLSKSFNLGLALCMRAKTFWDRKNSLTKKKMYSVKF